MHFDFTTFFHAFLFFVATYFGSKHGNIDGSGK